jgi:exonuclease SbcC
MLEELLLEDFQAHKKLRLRLGPGVTTLTGPSDRGKSSVIRALRWLCHNEPRGSGFVRLGAKGARITLTVDGRKVSRSNVGSNLYILDDKEFAAFGSAVPPEISALLSITPLNFQRQHDAPLWFSLGAGAVSRELNAVVNLALIDSTLSNLASAKRDAERDVATKEQELLEARRDIDELRDAEALAQAVAEADELSVSCSRKRTACAALSSLAAQHASHQNRLGQIQKPLLKLDRRLAELEKLSKRAQELAARAQSLAALLNEHKAASERLGALEEESARCQGELTAALAAGCPLCGR